jgi:hypothetical protein
MIIRGWSPCSPGLPTKARNHAAMTVLTAASTGKDLTILDCFDLLKTSRAKSLNVFCNRYPGIPYVWVIEPHETGYPHSHLVAFREFNDEAQHEIKHLWSEKHQAGSYDRGIEVTSKRSDESI